MEMVAGKKIARCPSNGTMKTVQWLLPVAALIQVPAPAQTPAFTFEIGAPAAAQDFRFKSALLVFRTTGCPEPDKVEVSGTAEGLVDGARRSLTLKLAPSSKPGVYGVVQQWGAGRWAVVLKGSCRSSQAGAVIPVGPLGFVRDASKFFTHPATAADIEAALKAFPEGGYK